MKKASTIFLITCFLGSAAYAKPNEVKFSGARAKKLFGEAAKAEFYTAPSNGGASVKGKIRCDFVRDTEEYGCTITELDPPTYEKCGGEE